MDLAACWEEFPALARVGGIRHAFTRRIPGVETDGEREEVLGKLWSAHESIRAEAGFGGRRLITAEQVHGNWVCAVDNGTSVPVAGADGLVTSDPEVCLGIYVADCCAVFLVDPVRRVIGLVHSGKRGTEAGIVPAAVKALEEGFGSRAEDLLVQLSPCIRPPEYDVDFALAIRDQAKAAGVRSVEDCGVCTARECATYYSYRKEKGRTGRMLALLALA